MEEAGVATLSSRCRPSPSLDEKKHDDLLEARAAILSSRKIGGGLGEDWKLTEGMWPNLWVFAPGSPPLCVKTYATISGMHPWSGPESDVETMGCGIKIRFGPRSGRCAILFFH